jgi:hypothetical protein
VAIVGAFDRFNYGDLLFPDVLGRLLRPSGARADFYTSVRSDLSHLGGQRTRPVKELLRSGALPDGGAVIVAGGEVLDASWTVTLGTLLSTPLAFLVRGVHHRLGEGWSDALCRRLAGARLERPWVLAPEDLPGRVRVAYNCVGGSSLTALPLDVRGRIENRMARAAFVSVRDAQTKALLEQGPLAGRVHLAPDSAVLISAFYPPEPLRKLATLRSRAIVRRYPNGYLCFQINKHLGSDKISLIADQLKKIYHRHGLAAVLLPNGRARHHEDQVVLAALRDRLHTPAALAGGELATHDIMYLIATARAYAGTSLHGSITALSYAVPHLGLTHAVPKLDAFLQTWDLAEQQCVELEDLADRLLDVLLLPRETLQWKREELMTASERNFQELFAALDISADLAITATEK